jgi:peroxiredoxin
MLNEKRFADRLARANATAAVWQPLYNRLIAEWRSLGIGASAPRVGERFPEFALPDARGRYHPIDELLTKGPIVLSFHRGEWCPYCRSELKAWHCALPRLEALNGRFVAISGEVGGRASSIEAILGDGAHVLCDVDHGVALTVGLAFFAGDQLLSEYCAAGIDLVPLYGTDSGFIPVPATFVIDTDRTVAFAFVDVDFRNRADPDTVLAAVAALGR